MSRHTAKFLGCKCYPMGAWDKTLPLAREAWEGADLCPGPALDGTTLYMQAPSLGVDLPHCTGLDT